MTKISVIIPVYNAESHLIQCVNSLLAQTLNTIEFIFVNDGSTDNSQKIIEEFQQKDSRIILINQDNQGVSVARNNGLEIATGDYIGFVDADDYLEKSYYQTLLTAIQKNNSDISCSNFSTEINGKFTTTSTNFIKNIPYDKQKINEELLPELIKSSTLNSACNKLYKKNILNKVTFPVGVTHGEDWIFNMNAFVNASSVIFIDYSGYFYKEVLGSATKNVLRFDYFQRILEAYNYPYKSIFTFSEEQILKWKSIRLIENVIALIHIYFEKNNGFSIFEKFKKIHHIIHDKTVKQSIINYYDEVRTNKTNYQKAILKSIKLKSVTLLFILVKYSQIRNK